LTSRVTDTEEEPPLLVPVTVYVVAVVSAVGVPEISPVAVSKVRPAGRVGEIDQDVTVPPALVGVFAVMAESLVRVNGLPV
tara:strand:- start:482 stop:724 length:243 start_codon:yes stop_codon:yes gene_type:complete